MTQSSLPPELPVAALDPSSPLPSHRRKSALAPILVVFGIFLFFAALFPSIRAWIDRQFDSVRLLLLLVGALCLFAAWLSRELFRMRARLLDLMEEVLRIFYGPNFRRDRQAVDILVRAMTSAAGDVKTTAHEHLVRLTGVDLGADAQAWETWWAGKRATFRSPHAQESPRRSSDDGV